MSGDVKPMPVYAGQLIAAMDGAASYHSLKYKIKRWAIAGMASALGLSLIGNAASGIAISAMMPLKQIQPVYIAIQSDGVPVTVTRISDLPPTTKAAFIRAAIWQYVRYREEYIDNHAIKLRRYNTVSRMSSPAVRHEYHQWFWPVDPKSPQIVLGKNGSISIGLIAMNLYPGHVVHVSFHRFETLNGQTTEETWSAILTYQRIHSLTAKARLADPGGIIITSYHSAGDGA